MEVTQLQGRFCYQSEREKCIYASIMSVKGLFSVVLGGMHYAMQATTVTGFRLAFYSCLGTTLSNGALVLEIAKVSI